MGFNPKLRGLASCLMQRATYGSEHGVEKLTAAERSRLFNWEAAKILRVESQFLQYEQGLLDEEFYAHGFVDIVRRSLGRWKAFGVLSAASHSFRKAVTEIEDEHGLM